MRFFTSDTHFGHQNILRFEPHRPGGGNIDHHDEILIANWNSVVQPDDTVFHLGDVALGPWERWFSRLSRLNGRIYLLDGNHDRTSPVMSKSEEKRSRWLGEYESFGFTSLGEVSTLRIFDPTTPTNFVDTGKFCDVLLSHYPFKTEPDDARDKHRVFDGQPEDTGLPLIHGHIHGNGGSWLKDHHSVNGTPMMHVGVDVWDFKPVSEVEIIEWLVREGQL